MSIASLLVENGLDLFCNQLNSNSILNDGLLTTQSQNVTNDLNVGDDLTVGGDLNVTSGNSSFQTLSCQDLNVSNQAIIGSALRYSATPTAGHVLTSNALGDASWQAIPAQEFQPMISPFVVDSSLNWPGSVATIQQAINDADAVFTDTSQIIYVLNRSPYNETLTIPEGFSGIIQGVCAPATTQGVSFSGTVICSTNSRVQFSNFVMSDNGVDPIFQIGDLVNVPHVTVSDCFISSSNNVIFSVSTQCDLLVENCICQSIGFDMLLGAVADNANVVLKNCPLLFSSSNSVVNLTAPGSTCQFSLLNCSVLSVNDISVRSAGASGVNMTISKSNISCGGFENVYVALASSLLSSYNLYSSSAVSTFVITGDATASVRHGGDYANATNVLIDPALSVVPLVAIS